MGKLGTLMVMISGLDLLFYFTGLATSDNTLLAALLNPSTIIIASIGGATITFAIQIAQILTSSGLAAITISTVISNLRYALIAPFVLFLLKIFGDVMVIFDKLASINAVFALLFFSPVLLLYGATIVAAWDTMGTL